MSQEVDGATNLSSLFFNAMAGLFVPQVVDMVLASECILALS